MRSIAAIQWFDIDMTSGEPLIANPAGGAVLGSTEGHVPVVRLFGVAQSGASVMASVHGFTPYFFASVPSSFALTEAALSALRVVFDQKVSDCAVFAACPPWCDLQLSLG